MPLLKAHTKRLKTVDKKHLPTHHIGDDATNARLTKSTSAMCWIAEMAKSASAAQRSLPACTIGTSSTKGTFALSAYIARLMSLS